MMQGVASPDAVKLPHPGKHEPNLQVYIDRALLTLFCAVVA